MVDLTFARAANVLGTGHSDKVFSALAGPEFFLIDRNRGNVFLHARAGVGLVDSAFLAADGLEFHGYVARFSFALGAGAEVTVHGPIALRMTADYQRTTFVNSVLGTIAQNNQRLGTAWCIDLDPGRSKCSSRPPSGGLGSCHRVAGRR